MTKARGRKSGGRVGKASGAEGERGSPFGWLPDGSALLLAMTSPTGKASLALLRLAGDVADSTRLRTLLSGSLLYWPRLSPEGRRLAYASDEAGKTQVYVGRFRPDGSLGRPVQVRTAEGSDPRCRGTESRCSWWTNGAA